MRGFPPKTFIIGAQKCGTTSLASLMGNNAEICLSDPKEPNYYTVNYEKGLDWYKSRFSDPQKVLLDASTTYTMCALSKKALGIKAGRELQLGVPGRIFNDSPDAKFIYIIREPVARIYSNYWHNVKYGYEKESIGDAVVGDPQYIHLSEYYGQLEKYLEFFTKEQILIVRFEDFIQDQQSVLNRCERFIGVNETSLQQEISENQSRQYGGIGRFILDTPLLRDLDRFLPIALKKLVKDILTKETTQPETEPLPDLADIFDADQRALKDSFGISYYE